mgnify:CR=1 FL=1
MSELPSRPEIAKLNLDMVDPLKNYELLNSVTEEVDLREITTSAVQEIIAGMFEVAKGKGHDKRDTRQVVGLAAPQVGVSKRIILIDLTANGANQEQTLKAIVNPQITDRSEDVMDGREGCWSCGNVCGNVERSKNVTLIGYDKDGKPVKYELTGFVARIAQHETDHLDGIRFPDRIPDNQPERLHLVRPEQFEKYRSQWQNWKTLCRREQWEDLKAGRKI